MSISTLRFPVLTLALLLALSPAAEAQFGGIIRGAINREARTAVNDAVSGTVECIRGDDECVQDANDNGNDVTIVDPDGEPILDSDNGGEPVLDSNGNPVIDPEEAEKLAQEPGEGGWRNYDFTPGKKVLYVSDFTNSRVGRFPSTEFGFDSGNGQTVEVEELGRKKMLETSASTIFTVELPETLPEDFSVEFFIKTSNPNGGLDVYFGPPPPASLRDSQHLRFGQSPGIYSGGSPLSSMRMNGGLAFGFHQVRLQVDGDYAVLYIGTERVANLPAAEIVGSDVITFHMAGGPNARGYISDVVVAAGIETFYDTLTETGEFTTRGIYFDSDSDVLRPESTPTLEDIRSTLTSNPDLRVMIEGHTDDRGDVDYNLDLSQRRARSVVMYLTENGVDGGQVDAIGKGEGEPVADNTNAGGRAENRRVVLRLAQN